MNMPEKQTFKILQRKTAFAVIAVHLISITVIFFVLGALRHRDDAQALTEMIRELDRSVATEKTIAEAVARLSHLARESGYELAVDDIIKDHLAAMTVVKGNLAVLKNFEREKTGGNVLIYIIIVFAVQGALLFLFLLKINQSASFTLHLISRQISDALSDGKIVREGGDKVIEFRDLYDDFGKLLDKIEAEDLKKPNTPVKKKKPT